MKEFETLGFWHLPEDPETRIAGTFRYDRKEGNHLSLSGSFRGGGDDFWAALKQSFTNSGDRNTDYELIHGIVDKTPYGKHVTLVHGWTRNQTIRSVGFATEEVNANIAYVGDYWLEKESPEFTSATIRLGGLCEWLGKKGIKREVVRENGGTLGVDVLYRAPSEPALRWNGVPLEIAWYWSSQSRRHSETISEDACFRLHDIPPASFELLMKEYVSPLQDLLTFAANEPRAVVGLSVASDRLMDDDTGKPARFQVLYSPIYADVGDWETKKSRNLLFYFAEIDDKQQLLDRWHELRMVSERFFSSFFGNLYAGSRYLDSRFTDVCHALENLTSDNHERPELTEALTTLRCHVANLTESPSWPDAVLPSHFELCFPINLLKEIQRHQNLVGPLLVQEPQDFVDRVVATQAHLRGRAVESSLVLRDLELYWATERLKAIAAIGVMERLGLTRELMDKIVRRNSKLAHLKTA